MPFLALDGAPPRELGPETSVGSGSQSTLRVQQKDLAARHFSIHLSGDGSARVVPASTQSVVVLNGEQVPTGGAALDLGDVIAAGAARFVYADCADATVPAPNSTAQKAHLIDAAQRKAFPLRKRVVQIGREVGCTIVLRDPTVSRFHADIRAEGGEYVLYATGSTGTKVNDQPVKGPRMLREGDQLEIGDTTLTFGKGPLPGGTKLVDLEDHRDSSFSRKGTMVMERTISADAKALSRSSSLMPALLGAAAVIIVLLAVIAFK